MNVSKLGEVMSEALYTLPSLCRVVEDGYGRFCGSARLVGLIVSELELGPPMSESSPRTVVRDALCMPSFI